MYILLVTERLVPLCNINALASWFLLPFEFILSDVEILMTEYDLIAKIT